MTAVPEVALGVLVADCAPVVLYDPARRAVGVAHCGRNGAVLDVVSATVATMAERYGSRTRDLLVGVGPAIGAAAYEIGERERDQVLAAFGDTGLLAPTRPGHWTFDLVGAVRARLREAGVADGNVEVQAVDTRATDRGTTSLIAQLARAGGSWPSPSFATEPTLAGTGACPRQG